MKELWNRMRLGIASTFGVAQVRRPVDSPAEQMQAVGAEVQAASRRARAIKLRRAWRQH